MRGNASSYLTHLLSLQHANYLLQAFGIDGQSLSSMLEKSNPAAAKSEPEDGRAQGRNPYLDTKSSFGEQTDLEEVTKSIPPGWVGRTLEHEKIKRRVAAALRSFAEDPPVKLRPRFDPDRAAKRLSLCQSSHLVLRSRADVGALSILPLMCLSPFCPSCARLRTARQLQRIGSQVRGLAYMRLRWITLTIKNCAPGDLSATLDNMLQAWKEFRAERNHGQWTQRVHGYLWSLEITLGRMSARAGGRGWHPHIHVLYDGDFWPQDELNREWQARLAARGLVGSAMIGAAYYSDSAGRRHLLDGRASADPENIRHIGECLEEVSKYILAPMESNVPRALVFELANALHGRHTKGSSGTLELRNVKAPPLWRIEGPLGACTDRNSKYYLESERDQVALIKFAQGNTALWANLCRYYEFFSDAERSTHES